MNRVMKYQDFADTSKIAEDFIRKISNPNLNESMDDKKFIKTILDKLSRDLKFNYGLVLSFGTGIGFMFPILHNLINNIIVPDFDFGIINHDVMVWVEFNQFQFVEGFVSNFDGMLAHYHLQKSAGQLGLHILLQS